MKIEPLTLAEAEARAGNLHGVFRMDEDAYHLSPGWSASMLNYNTDSKRLAAFQGRMKKPDTPAMAFGRAFHCFVLEPEEFPKRYAVEPEGLVGSKSKSELNGGCKEKWDAFKDSVGMRQYVTAQEYEKILNMAHAVEKHPGAREQIHGLLSHREVSMFWVDTQTGLQCRARCDVLDPIFGIADLKTSNTANPEKFFWTKIRNGWDDFLGYRVQLAHYLSGMRHVLNEWVPDFKFVVVEKEYPHDVSVIRVGAMTRGNYEDEYGQILEGIKVATETEHWPAYGRGIYVVGDI